jgi:hypothetical protein
LVAEEEEELMGANGMGCARIQDSRFENLNDEFGEEINW